MLQDGFSRRRFLKCSALLGAQTTLGFGLGRASGLPMDLAVVTGDSPERNCTAAVEALGGFSRFVREGDRVTIKPNPIGTSLPEQAIHTHPDMVGAVVKGCRDAGAESVTVLSYDNRRNMVVNGTAAAVEGAGGVLKALGEREEFREVVIPRSRILRTEPIAIDVLEADVFINMPIAKHHAGAEVTLTMKNLMGINWDRIRFHRSGLHQCIAELASAVRHDLVIMDANHVLLSNGPSGPGEVSAARQVIAGVDPVAVDAFALRYFQRTPESIDHIRIAHQLGVGEIDLGKLRIREYTA